MRARSEGRSTGSAGTFGGRAGMRAAGCALCLIVAAWLALGPAAWGASVTSATVRTATAPPPAGVHYEEESLEAFETQLHSADIAEAEFNKVAHHLHLTLRDGRHQLVDYEGHQEPTLQQRLLAAGVPVTIEFTTTSTKSTHHTLRYVAAGILVVVLIVLGVLLVARRRRLAQLEEQPGAGGQPASPGSE